MKKETDDASKKRLAAIEAEIENFRASTPTSKRSGRRKRAKRLVKRAYAMKSTASAVRWMKYRRQAQYEKLAELQYAVLPKLEESSSVRKRPEKDTEKTEKGGPKLLRTSVGAEEIAEVVSRATGIPVSKMMEGERQKLLHMADALEKRVIGQDEAVKRVTETIPEKAVLVCRIPTARTAASSSLARRVSARPS